MIEKVDLPVICTKCGALWYLTSDGYYSELERNGEVYPMFAGDESCPLCGGPVEEYPFAVPDED